MAIAALTIWNNDGTEELASFARNTFVPFYYKRNSDGYLRVIRQSNDAFVFDCSNYSGLAAEPYSDYTEFKDGDVVWDGSSTLDLFVTPLPQAAKVCSNDGSTILFSKASSEIPAEWGGIPVYGVGYFDLSQYGLKKAIYYVDINWNAVPPEILDLTDYDGLATIQNAESPDVDGQSNDGILCYASSIFLSPLFVVGGSPTPTGNTLDVTYNSTKIIDSLSVTPPVTVTYNGSTIATLNEGDTKTLDILGSDNKPKILATPIVIGGKTIPDVDVLGRKWVFEHNLVVEVGGALSETWLINESLPANSVDFFVSFTSNGEKYNRFQTVYAPRQYIMEVYYSYTDGVPTRVAYAEMVIPSSSAPLVWDDQAYRTITLDEPATGDFLTWLQANAVKQ